MNRLILQKDNVWFTSDTHFGHDNILKYADRPFKTEKEMTTTLIENWNKTVPVDGIVIHAGDFAFSSTAYAQGILDALHGRIHFVVGNHDKTVLKNAHLRERFLTIDDILDIRIKDDKLDIDEAYLVVCHYPLLSWRASNYGSIHLYGHVHGNLVHPKINTYEIGVDVNNYCPVSYEEIKKNMEKNK